MLNAGVTEDNEFEPLTTNELMDVEGCLLRLGKIGVKYVLVGAKDPFLISTDQWTPFTPPVVLAWRY